MNKNSAVAIFDSGIGGLTAVREFIKLAPRENIIYFGDTGRLPYGGRSAEIITKYALQDIGFLLTHDIKLILAACGTVSSTLGHDYTDRLPVRYMNVLGPAARAATTATKSDRIGIIGTAATIRSGAYRARLAELRPNAALFEAACPLFVPLVENGWVARDCNVTREVAESYLKPLRDARVDTLIMGCTHYPVIREIIADTMGPDVTLIDAGGEAAKQALAYLGENNLLNDAGGEHRYYISDDVEQFCQNAELFLGRDVNGSARLIEIDDYAPAL